MKRLVTRFGLALDNVDGGSLHGYPDTFSFDGALYPRSDIVDDWHGAYPAFHRAATQAPWPQKWNHHTDAGVALDRMSVPDWIEQNIPGGTAGRFGQPRTVCPAGEIYRRTGCLIHARPAGGPTRRYC